YQYYIHVSNICNVVVRNYTILLCTIVLYNEYALSNIPAVPFFADRAQYVSATISSNVRNNPPCVECHSARIQERHAANSEKESRHQKAMVAGATQQPKAANHLAEE